MSNFYKDVIWKDARFASTEEVRDLLLLEPVTRGAVQSIIAEALEQGIHLMVTETYRSKQRQQQMFTAGKSKLQHVGVHHYGLACDFCKITQGKPTWDGDWTFLCLLAVKHGLVCGYDWGRPEIEHLFRDPAHVQRVGVPDQKDLFAGIWYPDETFVPAIGSYVSQPVLA